MFGYRFGRPSRKTLLHWLLPIVSAIIVGACGIGPPVGPPTETAIQPTATGVVAPTTTAALPTLVPTSVSAANQATLTAEQDRVRYKLLNQDEQELAIQGRQQIGKGDAISVDDNGRAWLNFRDAIRVDIFKQTKLSMNVAVDSGAAALDLYALEGGTTLNQIDLDKLGAKRVRLETTWAVIDDLGTEFIAYHDETSEATWIVVRKGVTEVLAPLTNQMVRVNAGEQTWIDPRQQPIEPVQPVPATRAAVGDRFPPLEDLTDGEITDDEWLPSLSAIALDSTTLASGQSTQGTLTLSGPAFGGGLDVTLFSSDPTVASVPVSVTVATDATSQRFSVTAGVVNQPTDVVITASYQNDSQDVTLRILPPPAPSPSPSPAPSPSPSPSPPALADLTLNPAQIESGTPGSATVTLAGPAPADGVEISLISFDETLATVPPTITVPAGSDTATFEIQTLAVAQDSEATIRASDINGPPIDRVLTLLAPPRLASFTIEPPRVTAGAGAQGQVVLTRPAPVGGLVVDLAGNSRLVRVPDSVTIAEGDDRAVFKIATAQVRQEFQAPIRASLGDDVIDSLLTVVPAAQPDLMIQLGQADVSCGGKPVVCYLTVGFTVSNVGTADAVQRFPVAIQADALSPATIVVDGLAAGQQVDLRARLGPGGNCYDPDCTVTATVDPDNAIPESDEQNNSTTETWNG